MSNRSKVYFSSDITPEKVLELYKLLGVTLPGNVAVKVHSGEKGNQNFLRPDFWRPVIEHVGGTVVECNTAYNGMRNTTEKHLQLFAEHGWTDDHDQFLESMADAAASVVELFKGNIVYINVMKNMSVDCDCCAVAEDPCIADIGILISTDPIAIDQACVDLVYACSDPGKPHLIERIESRNGIHTVEAAAELGFGSREYELITV